MNKERVLGKTGFRVTLPGLGGLCIQRRSMKKAVEVVRHAVKRGINFIDTARSYTDSEEKLGKALSGINEKVFLATKTQARDREGALEDIHKSLDLLRVKKIDIYQLHAVNDLENLNQVNSPGGALEALKEARDKGLIDYIGISGHNNELLVKALKTEEYDTVQFCYNYIEDDCERELIPLARSKNIGMLAMKPLAGGRLTEADVALKYILNQEGVIPIPGMEKIKELDENIDTVRGSWHLSAEDKISIERMKKELGKVFCRRCGYCLPCPEEVPIPIALRSQSFINRVDKETLCSGWVYDAYLQAKSCTECGACIEKCPYQLPIPRLIIENRKLLEDYYSSIE